MLVATNMKNDLFIFTTIRIFFQAVETLFYCQTLKEKWKTKIRKRKYTLNISSRKRELANFVLSLSVRGYAHDNHLLPVKTTRRECSLNNTVELKPIR